MNIVEGDVLKDLLPDRLGWLGLRHLVEFGQIVPQGTANAVVRATAIIKDPGRGLPAGLIAMLKVLVGELTHPETEIGKLDAIAPRL